MQTKVPLFAQTHAPDPPGWFSRTILRTTDPVGALAAARNLVATVGVEAVSLEGLEKEIRRYGVAAGQPQAKVLQTLYESAFESLAGSRPQLDAGDRQTLRLLATHLKLAPKEVADCEATASRAVLRSAVRRALEDKRFTDTEKQEVEALGTALGVAQEETVGIVLAEVEPLLAAAGTDLLKDRRYSPQEEETLKGFAKQLGVTTLKLDATSEAITRRFRLLWEIENGQLPQIYAPISLQRGEVCHFSSPCSWRELRTRTVRVNYAGVSSSIRIMKGMRFRMGSFAPQRVTETNLVEVAKGTLYITNKRILLDGTAGNKAIAWRSLFGQEVFSDAIKLEKSSGKDPYLFLPSDEIELASVVIAAAMSAGG